jgi:uncharacterized protein
VPVAVAFSAVDGVALEGELEQVDAPRAAMVLCHPHPLYGGTMRSIVVSELFRALPARGVSCLRFNFRGVEGSEGTHDEGIGERQDALAAIATLDEAIPAGTPLVLMGWSFGADVALSVVTSRLAAWLVVAPPLRFAEAAGVAADPRTKLVVLAEHDEFRAPADVVAATETWTATTVEVVGGASHFFVGRTDAVVAAADRLIDGVAR